MAGLVAVGFVVVFVGIFIALCGAADDAEQGTFR